MIYIIVHNPGKVKRVFKKKTLFFWKKAGWIWPDLISEREEEGFGKTFSETRFCRRVICRRRGRERLQIFRFRIAFAELPVKNESENNA